MILDVEDFVGTRIINTLVFVSKLFVSLRMVN